jgi:hypothetical protein
MHTKSDEICLVRCDRDVCRKGSELNETLSDLPELIWQTECVRGHKELLVSPSLRFGQYFQNLSIAQNWYNVLTLAAGEKMSSCCHRIDSLVPVG